MKIYQKYLILVYLKNFFIVFIALQLFYTGIDLMQNFEKLQDSANIQILYAIFKFLNAMNVTVPLSLLFAMIISKFKLIRSNELAAMYSLGISKNSLVRPVFFSSLAVTIIYIMLNATPFAYSNEYAKNILKYSHISNTSTNLFLKYYDNYIYFAKLDPYKKEVSDIRVFMTRHGDLIKIIKAKSANFIDEHNVWELKDVTIIKKPKMESLYSEKLIKEHRDRVRILQDFQPKIIESIYEGKNSYTIFDAIKAIKLFTYQDVNVDTIRASLFIMVISPLFAPILMLSLFYYLPANSRFFDLALLSSVFVFISLAAWAVLFILSRISLNSVIAPEIGIILPVSMLSLVSIYLYFKHK